MKKPHKFSYKLVFFEIKNGSIGSNEEKYFNTTSEIKRFMHIRKNTLADFVVFDLINHKVITSEFKYV